MSDDAMTPITRLAAWTADPEVHEFSTDDGENLLDLIQRIREEGVDTIERLTAENNRNAQIVIAAMRKAEIAQKERDEAQAKAEDLQEIVDTDAREFEGECWGGLSQLLDECGYQWTPGDSVTVTNAVDYIREALQDKDRWVEKAERKRDEARASALREAASLPGWWLGVDGHGEPDGTYCSVKPSDDPNARLYISAEAILALVDKADPANG